jgi:L-iditol 2-dehydrogenase
LVLVKAARLHGVGDIRISEEPVPEPAPDMSLVKVTAVGLCGSDLHWYAEAGIGDAKLEQPLVVGHEFAGVIEGGPRHGERVAVDPAIPCNGCDVCLAGFRNLCPTVGFAGHGTRDGALQEYVAWPTALLHRLPDTLSSVDGAMLEPLGVALHALDLGRVRVGTTVGVFGCGPIGLLLVQLARLAGATTVIAADPLRHRRDAAARLGADQVWDPDRGQDLAGFVASVAGLGVDVAFDMAGTDAAVHDTLIAARPGARVVLVGIPDGDTTTFRASLARRKGLSLILARRMNETYPRAIRLVQQGRVDVTSLVTERYPIDATPEAFAAAVSRRGLKVVVEPSN